MSERQPVTAWPSVPEQTLSLLGGAAACVREPGLARVTCAAIEAFGDEAKARRWLTSPNRALQQHMPLDLIASDAGAQAVTDELGRIDYGELY